jgi:hypothetical protein
VKFNLKGRQKYTNSRKENQNMELPVLKLKKVSLRFGCNTAARATYLQKKFGS